MDLRYTEEYEAFREEVRAFLGEAWRGDRSDAGVRAFRERAIGAGYQARGVPTRYGGSEQPPDVLKAAIIREEFARAGAPGELGGGGVTYLVPTLLECGEEWQRERFIPPTLRGDMTWCQGYSEPGSGSDLASLQTRAELVDDHWVIHGQKIWTSGAQRSDYMFVLVRTEPDAPKHAGISYLLLDMRQPGIDVRPLKQMTGEAHFNEVFLNGARTPADWIVGKRGEGWKVSRATLRHERNSIGNAEQCVAFFDGLVGRARDAGLLADPRVRQRLAELEGYVRAHEYSGYRQLTAAARGKSAGLVELMNKLVWTHINHEVSRFALDLVGGSGLLAPTFWVQSEAPRSDTEWNSLYMATLGGAIAGGTSNIQRNVIAERGLGLPRERAADRAREKTT